MSAAAARIDPLAEPLNPAQRRWFTRMQARHQRLDDETLRLTVERDRFLLSAQARGLWAGLVCGIAGTSVGLALSGVDVWVAMLTAMLTFAGLLLAGMSAWVAPQRFSGKRLRRIGLLAMIATYAGTLATFRYDLLGLIYAGMPWYRAAAETAWRATPLQLMVLIAALVMLAAISTTRREYLQRALAQAHAEQERDGAARQLAQARLALLQAQIQPHFLFNTLAALQHWVDTGDARAPDLLRRLTAFLRVSTESMLMDDVPLAQEIEHATHYLEIMRARLGDRLAYQVDIAADCRAPPLPPGLLLTLVENAIEHGIEPQLRGGRVEIRARRDAASFELCVADDGMGLPPDPVDGVGLANSRERLQHRYGGAARLSVRQRADGPGTEAVIAIPLA
jgi:signal transduction histidine kinase